MRSAVVAILALVASTASAGWTLEPIAPYGLKSSLAVADDGTPHVAYTTCYWHGYCFDGDPAPGRLWYATTNRSTWHVVEVDSDGGYGNPSLVLRSGTAHIAYQHVAWHGFRYAVGDAGGFALDDVDHEHPTYAKKNPSLVLDASGRPHIGYYEREGIVYATRFLDTWNEEKVPQGYLEEWRSLTPLAFDAQARPVIVAKGYFTGEWAYRRVEQGWTEEQIDDTRDGHDTALVADAEGSLHAIYAAQGEAGPVVRYATDASGAWITEDVAPGNLPGSIAVDATGRVHVVFLETDPFEPFVGRVSLAIRTDGAWETEPIAPEGQHPSLAVDASGHTHVTFHRPSDRTLVYAVHDGVVPAERTTWGGLRARYRN